MMHYIAIVTSIVSFFRSLGGIVGLTLMSSVVNNKVSNAFANSPVGTGNSDLNSLSSIQNLPPSVLAAIQDAFANAIRWAYIAILPFVCISAISCFFLREVKIERSSEEEQRKEEEKKKTDAELGQIPQDGSSGSPRQHKPRIKVIGPIGGIIWLCQALGDKMGWRK
jgi:fucose permease